VRFFSGIDMSMVTRKSSGKNSRTVISLFWLTLVFQTTVLKYVWLLDSISRWVNLLILLTLVGLALNFLPRVRVNKFVWFWCLFPSLLIIIGFSANIGFNSLSNLGVMSLYGLTIPWFICILVPYLLKKRDIDDRELWKAFYLFMLVSSFLAITEYFAIFFGLYPVRPLETPYGHFLAGFFSILHKLEDGAPYYRLYSCFLEPGTLAMFLLPAIIYAFVYKKKIGVAVFLIALFLTDSLGGAIGFLMVLLLLPYILASKIKKNFVVISVSALILFSLLWAGFESKIHEAYVKKDSSAELREDNFLNTLKLLPFMLTEFPFGIKLETNTEDFKSNSNYLGSNFLPGFYLQIGGGIAFFGYLLILFISLITSMRLFYKSNLDIQEKVVLSSIIVMMPFVFQRTTVWESSLFAFLLLPTIVRALKSKSIGVAKTELERLAERINK